MQCRGLRWILLVCAAVTLRVSADELAVIANPTVATPLTAMQAANIFLGKVHTLPNGMPVVPLDQSDVSDVRAEFYLRTAHKDLIQVRAYWSRVIFSGHGEPPHEYSDDEIIKHIVARNPNAIGYIHREHLDPSVVAVLFLK